MIPKCANCGKSIESGESHWSDRRGSPLYWCNRGAVFTDCDRHRQRTAPLAIFHQRDSAMHEGIVTCAVAGCEARIVIGCRSCGGSIDSKRTGYDGIFCTCGHRIISGLALRAEGYRQADYLSDMLGRAQRDLRHAQIRISDLESELGPTRVRQLDARIARRK